MIPQLSAGSIIAIGTHALDSTIVQLDNRGSRGILLDKGLMAGGKACPMGTVPVDHTPSGGNRSSADHKAGSSRPHHHIVMGSGR